MAQTSVSIIAVLWLVSATAAHAAYLASVWPFLPMSAMLSYEPSKWPSSAWEGWNFTTVEQRGESPYIPPLFDANAKPLTRLAGAQVTTRFYGWGATVGGWTGNNTRLTIKLDTGETNTTTFPRRSGNLTSIFAPQQENKWYTLSIVLEEGALQIHNVTLFTDVDVNYPRSSMAPRIDQNTTTNGSDINPFYTTSGNWVAQDMYDPGSGYSSISS